MEGYMHAKGRRTQSDPSATGFDPDAFALLDLIFVVLFSLFQGQKSITTGITDILMWGNFGFLFSRRDIILMRNCEWDAIFLKKNNNGQLF